MPNIVGAAVVRDVVRDRRVVHGRRLLSTSGNGDPEHIEGEMVSSDYFQTLRVTPVAGRDFRAEEDTVAGAHPVAMISWRLWQRKFAGDPALDRRARSSSTTCR